MLKKSYKVLFEEGQKFLFGIHLYKNDFTFKRNTVGTHKTSI